jgi:hypothetical protein
VPRIDIAGVLTEVHRTLRPGGLVVVATHLGEGELSGASEWFGKSVEPLCATLHRQEELETLLRQCSYDVDEAHHRTNLPHEAPTERVYITATARA